MLEKKIRSILTELAEMPVTRDRANLVESRASHVIQGAINLINYIKEHYDADAAGELERRLLNSIRSQDPKKFTRGVRKIKNEN
jgi:hypothetical protein|tara:strand:+ start:200 stop:451 length:252 start_codon:yes stop_codon:yes gene_type:complete